MFDRRECTIKLPAQTVFELRYILPLVSEAVGAEPEAGSTQAMLEQAVAAFHEALPADLRGIVDERAIAEKRMDAIDAQIAAGVREPATSAPAQPNPTTHLSGRRRMIRTYITRDPLRAALLEIQGICQEVAHEVEDPTQAVGEIEQRVRKALRSSLATTPQPQDEEER